MIKEEDAFFSWQQAKQQNMRYNLLTVKHMMALLKNEKYSTLRLYKGPHLCLSVENVDETLAALREHGVQVTREPFDVPPIGKRCGFVADPCGNTLELIQALG